MTRQRQKRAFRCALCREGGSKLASGCTLAWRREMSKAQDDDLVMSLLDRALGQPQEDREAYVRAFCGSDAELLNQVLDYVRSEARMDGFMQNLFWDDFQLSLPEAASSEHSLQPGRL